MTNRAKKEIMKNLCDDISYTCIYGIRKELFNIDNKSISGYGSSSSQWQSFDLRDDEHSDIAFEELHSISAEVPLFANNVLDSRGLRISRFSEDDVSNLEHMSNEADIDITVEELSGCWILMSENGNKSAWSYVENMEHELHAMSLDKDDNIVLGPVLGVVEKDYIKTVRFNSENGLEYFVEYELPEGIEFVSRVTTINIEEIKNQIRGLNNYK